MPCHPAGGNRAVIHYEALCLTSLAQLNFAPRKRILVVIYAAFIAHVVDKRYTAKQHIPSIEWRQCRCASIISSTIAVNEFTTKAPILSVDRLIARAIGQA